MNTLRNYQIELLDKIKHTLAEDRNNRVIAVLPCRSGKSFIIKYIAENHLKKQNAVVWIVIHRKELKEQLENLLNGVPNCYVVMAQSIVRNFDKFPKPTMVMYDECFPKSTKILTINGEQNIENLKIGDLVLSFNHKNHQLEYKPITHLFKKISNSLIKLKLSNNKEIICTSNHPFYTKNGYVEAKDLLNKEILFVQKERTFFEWIRVESIEIQESASNGRFSELCEENYVYNIEVKDNNNYFANNILVHNCHHALANIWLQIINYTLPAYQIGFTATPCRTNGDGLGKVFNKLIVGVDCIYLLENHFISDYDYYAPKLNITFNKMKGSDYDQDEVAEIMSENKIYTDVITSYLKYAKDKKTIMYCPTIKFSKDMVDKFNEHGIKAVHFDGSTSKTDRTEIYNDFKNGKIKILSNVDLISEGVTISDCDCCLLLRPTQSLTLFIQQSMRCLTYAPNKKAIILDLVGNCYRHGLPTDNHERTLEGKMKCKNPSGEKDILVRQCKNCFRVYKGTSPICPYCEFNNGKTKREIEIEEKAELEKVEHINKVKARMTVGMCKTRSQLEKIAKERGYKKGWVYYQCKVKNIPFK